MKDFIVSNKKLLIILSIVVVVFFILFLIFKLNKPDKLVLKCEMDFSLQESVQVHGIIEIYDSSDGRKYVESQKITFDSVQNDTLKLYKDMIFLSLVQRKINDDVTLNFVDESDKGFTSVVKFNLDSIDQVDDLKRVYSDLNVTNDEIKSNFESKGMKCKSF